MLKTVGLLAFFTFCGVSAGTWISTFVVLKRINAGAFLVSLVLSPLEMTVSIINVFTSPSTLTPTYMKIATLVGIVIWGLSVYYLVTGKPKFAFILAFTGALFWSLPNMIVFQTFMSV